MMESAIRFTTVGLVFLALILGGSAQAIWGSFALVVAALILLGLIVWAPTDVPRLLGRLPLIGSAFAVLLIVQLIPLPPGLWAALPGRAMIAHGFDLLQLPRPWLPWSLSPADSLIAMLSLVVPLAVFAGAVRDARERPFLLIAALGAGTLLGVLLGFLQVRDGGGDHWYLYRFSAFGQASGFFANSNHMGSLLLANIPFVAALAADQFGNRTDISQRGLVIGVGLGFGLILIIAIALNHSLAVMMLGGPVILMSLAIPTWPSPKVRKALAGFALLALIIVVGLGALGGRFGMATKESSIQTRSEIWSTTGAAISDYGFSGSGLGTFEKVYRLYENPDTVDPTFVNHAHNDYLEFVFELGLPGLILITMFLWWWGRRVRAAWRRDGSVYARAASIASAAILIHSLVDFPLRTAAISAVFAMCLGMMVVRFTPVRADGRKELWDTRHLSIA